MNIKRELTAEEKKFVREALDGDFGVLLPPDYDPPAAMGAKRAGRLFSMKVVEIDDPLNSGAIYQLPHCA
jgi:hypothetical protein